MISPVNTGAYYLLFSIVEQATEADSRLSVCHTHPVKPALCQLKMTAAFNQVYI